jgi:hypothetical protein
MPLFVQCAPSGQGLPCDSSVVTMLYDFNSNITVANGGIVMRIE